MARFRGLPRSLRLGFLALALLGGLTTYVWAQGVGIFSRSLCTSLTSPVAGQTFCFEQSTNTLKFYTGAATAPWVNITATESSVNNVRDFGAVGNNVADDTTAIINAIARDYNAGTQNGTAQTNRIVFFPPGIYKITSAIEVPPNVIIRGTGRFSVDTVSGTGFTASIINKSHNGVAFRFVDRNGIATGSLWQMGGIEDMGFSGNGASDTTASRFIELGDANTVNTATGAWEVFIRRNTFSTSSGYGIYSAHSQTANIEQNWFNSVKFPIYYNTVVSAARIERNTFLDQTVIAGAIAIQMRPGSLGGSAGGPMIVGNYFLGFQYGVWVTSIVGPQIRDNVLESTQHSPIQLDAFLSDTVTQDGNGPVSGVVDGNTFINWGAAGANEPAIRLNYTQNFYIGAQAYHSPNAAVVTSHIALFDNACSPQCTKNNVIVDPICTGSNCGTTPGVPNSSVTLQNTIVGRNYLQQQTVAGDLSGLGGGHAGRFWWNASSKSLRLFDGSSTFSVASFAELNINGPGVQVGAPTGGAKGTGQLNATAIYVNGKLVVTASGAHVNSSVTFASGLLNTLTADGMQIYCSDCTAAGALDQTCVGGGTGNLAVRVNGVAKCAY